jgi:predicted MFS family arabinose efflux permease
VDCGIPQIAAAGSLALMGAMNFVGTLASGWLTDRYDPRKLLALYYGFRGLSLLLLPTVTMPAGWPSLICSGGFYTAGPLPLQTCGMMEVKKTATES